MSKTATVIGATGLIGSHLLDELLKDPFYDTVRILTRRPLSIEHAKLEKKLVDFDDSDSLLVAIDNSDVVFCAIGTTNKKVKGDNDAYRKVDYDIPVKLARFCKMTGCEIFVVVSANGADSKSRYFYLRLKGEMENAIAENSLRSVHIMRPSFLLGKRKEFRLRENFGKKIASALSFLLSSKHKPIHARKVAKAMVAAAKKNEEGVFVYEYKELMGTGH